MHSLSKFLSRLSSLLLLCSGGSLIVQATTKEHYSKLPLQEAQLTVNTTSGIYTGFIDTSTAPNVNQWLGIRYGKPPTGPRRFRAPEAATSPTYSLSQNQSLHSYAYEYKPICFQQSGDHTGPFWELVPEFQNQDAQSEDCLFLNIWAPRGQGNGTGVGEVGRKVPVIVWICGGGYQEGGGHAPYQVPDQWVQRMQTHIVVTLNYRLNVFGYPGAAAANENVGLLDVRLVIEWVKSNIAGFGGDHEHIIIWGQSAGAGVVESYLYAHGEDPIIAGAIANSGSPIEANNNGPSNPNVFTQLAKIVGCGNQDSAKEELACMQEVPALRLQDIIQSKSLPGTNITVPRFAPGVDNTTVFLNNTERLERGLVAKVPLITGHTINENAAFLLFNKTSTTAPPPLYFPGLECSVIAEVERRLKYRLPTYRYLFAGNFSNITPRYWLGAMHSSDLPVIFGTHYQFRGNSTELEWETSFAMEDLWVDFAANPSKDPAERNGLVWPKYSANSSTIVKFGDKTKPVQLISSASLNTSCPNVSAR